MTILEKNTNAITRIYLDDLEGLHCDSNNRSLASTMLDYHDGNDVQHIKQWMAERFATEITRTEDDKGNIQYNQTKSKKAQVAAIRHNLFEVTPRGTTRKVTTNVATLSENSIFKFEQNGQPADEFAIDLTESRDEGQFGLMFSRLDEVSVVAGSACLLIQVSNGEFQYQAVLPDKVWIIFGEQLEVDGDKMPVNELRLDHAQCIILQTDEDQYAAYFARSTEYEQGRFVQYESKNWANIPDVGTEETGEYIGKNGEIANPLTEMQDTYKEYTTPEYPIVTWQGTTSGIGKELLPVVTNLYEASKEIDLTASRTSMSANKAARGAWYVYTDSNGVSGGYSSVDEGVNKMAPGETATVLTVPAGNIDAAEKVNKSNTQYLLDSYSIPSYNMSADQAVNMPSGAALMEANKPSVKYQEKRKDINDSSMSRWFEIEKSLATIENGEMVGKDVEQIWELKPADIYKTDLEILTEGEKRIAMNISDPANELAKVDNITVEQAQEKLDELVVVPVPNRLGL
jgi:hypothetical protein